MTNNKIRGALRFMNVKTRNIIIESKIIGQINGFLQLVINHNQNVQKKVQIILMDYIWIINKNTFKQPIEKNARKQDVNFLKSI